MELLDIKQQIEHYLSATQENRRYCGRDRDYYDGRQWTPEEVAILRRRKQAPIVINRIKPKVEALKGFLNSKDVAIRAYPRNKKDGEVANAATDALRYIADNNNFSDTKVECFEELVIEGNCACVVEVKQKKEVEIVINRIPWDRFYYDPYSSKKDFSDAKYMGIMVWMDEEDIKSHFPNAQVSQNVSDDTDSKRGIEWTKPDGKRRRYRIAQHFYLHNNQWHTCIISGDDFLTPVELSPFLDDEGNPDCPIVAQSSYIDRENNRYGEVRSLVSLQDEINHRRSKALHLLNSNKTIARRGVIGTKPEDIRRMKSEMAKPDGHIEVNGEMSDFQILNQNNVQDGQFQLYQDAKNDLDSNAINPQLLAERTMGTASGVALDKIQGAGALTVNSLFASFSHWEREVFRKCWARIKQFWNEEKWIKITDDNENLRWVGLNAQVTFQELLEETINDESKSKEERIGANHIYTELMQQQDPRLGQIVEIRNETSNLDVDIILEQSSSSITSQEEHFKALVEFAKFYPQDIDVTQVISASNLKNKNKIIDEINKRRAQNNQNSSTLQELEAQSRQVEMGKKYAEAQLVSANAEQKAIENLLLKNNPDPKPQVNT